MLTPEIMTAISTVGFPICAYFLQVNQSNKVQAKLADAVNNNTVAIKELMSISKGA